MLKDTLVIWGRIWTYPIWPIPIRRPKETYGAGSLRPGLQLDHGGRRSETGSTYGESDEFGWNVTKDPVHVHDMQATILHLCCIYQDKLTFRYQGRQFRLTDVHGHVKKGMLI